MSHPLRRLALAAAFLLAAACASRGNGSAGGGADLYVLFGNNTIHQASVYAITAGGTTTRVGTVFAGRRERLRLPATVLAGTRTIEFEARMLSKEGTPRSGQITFAPGDSLEVSLSSDGLMLSVLPLRGGK